MSLVACTVERVLYWLGLLGWWRDRRGGGLQAEVDRLKLGLYAHQEP